MNHPNRARFVLGLAASLSLVSAFVGFACDVPDLPVLAESDDGGGADSAGGDALMNIDGGSSQDSGANNSPICMGLKSLTLSPPTTTQTVVPGTPFKIIYSVTGNYTTGPSADLTDSTFFTVSNIGVGGFAKNVFTWGGTQGGVVTVTAKSCGMVVTASVTLKLSVDLSADGDGGIGGPGDAGAFSADASTTTACQPAIVYPPDGVLLPPNLDVLEIHWKDGSPQNSSFDIAFENSATSVHVITSCSGANATQGTRMAGGCVFQLSQAEWDFIAGSNRNGDPVSVTVRGVGCDGTKVASSAPRSISFAEEDLRGTLYYWSSLTLAGPIHTGGVFRHDFSSRSPTSDPVLTPTSTINSSGLCIGCHAVSRDGRQMVFAFDDNDGDDEYADQFTDVYDIAAGTAPKPLVKNGANFFPMGYFAWERTTTQFLSSDGSGDGKKAPVADAGSFRFTTTDGGSLGSASPNMRGTTPDWSPDNKSVVFSVAPYPTAAILTGPDAGYWMKVSGAADDLMFGGASLYTSAWDPVGRSLGPGTLLVASDAANVRNYYYPNYSPDGSLIVFDFASGGSNFHNPTARVQVVRAGQGAAQTPDDLAKLNDVGSLTNSWPRWSPFVQRYKGKKLLWITLSSTRNYGLRIDNTGNVNCYPQESPTWVTPSFASAGNCSRSQMWMAAVDLDTGKVQAGADVSHPAFYVPFQDITTNNHMGQWAQKSFQGTCTTAAECMGQPGKCCDNGGCTACPAAPTALPATCSTNVNCAVGECCTSGQCGACGSPDGGVSLQCSTCIDCQGQACNDGVCGACASSSDCCAPLVCVNNTCK